VVVRVHLEEPVLRRAVLLLLIAAALPFRASAARYVVQAGDTLTGIAQRYHLSVAALARVNGITNINLIQTGRVLFIPPRSRTFYYHVQWGDTLIGIGSRYHLSITTIRSLNPSLGTYLLAGQWLKLCSPCSSGYSPTVQLSPSPSSGTGVPAATAYLVQPGDTLSGIAARYGTYLSTLMMANRITNPDHIVIGTRLVIPRAWNAGYDPYQARALIVAYARRYGLEPSLPLAVGWQESGFNQTVRSSAGAIGVMQVEPYTAAHIARLWGRSVNLYNVDDNIRAGVFWLAVLVSYYGGNERLAIAAYYEGTKALARYGMFADTLQYVNNVLALKTGFGG
jgi:LysM repeat protein